MKVLRETYLPKFVWLTWLTMKFVGVFIEKQVKTIRMLTSITHIRRNNKKF